MGILVGLVAAGAWLILWLVAWGALDLDMPAGIAGLVVGLALAFGIGVRLAHPRFRSDPVSRVEQRRRARERFEARVEQPAVDDRAARLAEADREADARAEARVRAIIERRKAAAEAGAEAAPEAGTEAAPTATGSGEGVGPPGAKPPAVTPAATEAGPARQPGRPATGASAEVPQPAGDAVDRAPREPAGRGR
jgi:hypothetical protein